MGQTTSITIEPFDLKQPVSYDVVIDRLTHWYHTSREWIKKAVLMDGLYVFNNPWSVQSMEKQTSYETDCFRSNGSTATRCTFAPSA